jgi:hypothetical protein
MKLASRTFLSPQGFNIGSLKFRDITMGDTDLAFALGVTMLGIPEGETAASPAAPVAKQIVRLLWMLHVPDGMDKDAAIEAVLTAVEDGTWEAKTKMFAFKLSPGALAEMTNKLQAEAAEIDAAAVKVAEEEQAEDGEAKKKAASQEDSPASSGPSAAEG